MNVWFGLWEVVLIFIPAAFAVWRLLRPWRPVLQARLGEALAWVTLLGLLTGPLWWTLTLHHDRNVPGHHWYDPWWFAWLWGIVVTRPWVAVIWLIAVLIVILGKGLWLGRILIAVLLVVFLYGAAWNGLVRNLQNQPTATSQQASQPVPVCVQMRKLLYDKETIYDSVNGDELKSRNAFNDITESRKGIKSAWPECVPTMTTTVKVLPQGCSRTVVFVAHSTFAGKDLTAGEDNRPMYEWLFGDPNQANSSHTSSNTISKTYSVPGKYRVTLRPTDVWKTDGEDEYPPITLQVKVPPPHC
jgi:hypothetical protein